MELDQKLGKLRHNLHHKKVIVAFSGGADSTLLALLAKEVADNPIAVTVDNGVMPPECLEEAAKIAQKIGIEHIIVKDNLLMNQSFCSNPPNRCYICKNMIYTRLEEILKNNRFDFIADGTNISDLMEDRPGVQVNLDKNIKTPLIQAGLTSEEVREALNNLKLEYHPSTTCFATRIPTGIEITPKRINRIAYVENLIRNATGLKTIRVRDHDGLARIEVENLNKILDRGIIEYLDSEFKAIGFDRVMLDLEEYVDSKKDLIIYKPCKDEKNKIMFEIELPYQISIPDTCQELAELGEVKCSKEMGIAMVEIEGSNITIFGKGKVVARRVKDQKDANELLVNILPYIRRVK
ncbi:MAG: ATP-dependent sacrificial sulfur transferase LarE [Methanobacteriaceae archaeon]